MLLMGKFLWPPAQLWCLTRVSSLNRVLISQQLSSVRVNLCPQVVWRRSRTCTHTLLTPVVPHTVVTRTGGRQQEEHRPRVGLTQAQGGADPGLPCPCQRHRVKYLAFPRLRVLFGQTGMVADASSADVKTNDETCVKHLADFIPTETG